MVKSKNNDRRRLKVPDQNEDGFCPHLVSPVLLRLDWVLEIASAWRGGLTEFRRLGRRDCAQNGRSAGENDSKRTGAHHGDEIRLTGWSRGKAILLFILWRRVSSFSNLGYQSFNSAAMPKHCFSTLSQEGPRGSIFP